MFTVLLLGIYPNKANSKRYMHPYVYSSTSHNSQDMETTKGPSTDEWIKKMSYIYTMEYYSAIKKKNKNKITPLESP